MRAEHRHPCHTHGQHDEVMKGGKLTDVHISSNISFSAIGSVIHQLPHDIICAQEANAKPDDQRRSVLDDQSSSTSQWSYTVRHDIHLVFSPMYCWPKSAAIGTQAIELSARVTIAVSCFAAFRCGRDGRLCHIVRGREGLGTILGRRRLYHIDRVVL